MGLIIVRRLIITYMEKLQLFQYFNFSNRGLELCDNLVLGLLLATQNVIQFSYSVNPLFFHLQECYVTSHLECV